MKYGYSIWFLIVTLSIGITGCTNHAATGLLAQVERMENVSTDSMLFYLQQIRHPHQLTGMAQADYCFLLYKATLWKTGKPKDSLLQVCIPGFLQAKDSVQWINARIEQAGSFLYTQQPGLALRYVKRIQNDTQRMNDSLRAKLYGIARVAYAQQEAYPQALEMGDSCLRIARQMNDTSFIFRTAQIRFWILRNMNRNNEFIEGSERLMHTLNQSANYRSLNYELVESLITFYLQNKDFAKALTYSELLKHYQRSRNDVPYYQLMRARTHEALNQIDSAKVYYTLASNSLSTYVAAEATSSLFQLINAQEYPEQAFYIGQKGKEIERHLRLELNSRMQAKEYNETKLQSELYQLRLNQQENELWMMGVAIVLLFIALIVSYFYQREKKKRLLSEQIRHQEQIEEEARQLQYENILLHKEHKLREAIFRRISFFQKISLLHTNNEKETNSLPNRKIEVTDTEWREIRLAINEGFDNFAIRLQRAYPLLTEKDIYFCCLVKININIQDLSDIYCVSKAAITKRKYRIKTEKFGIIDENSNLDQVLQKF